MRYTFKYLTMAILERGDSNLRLDLGVSYFQTNAHTHSYIYIHT